MKKILFPTLLLLTLLIISCNSEQNKVQTEDSSDKHEKAVVYLKEKQIKFINLKLGTFVMRNLTRMIKSNGQLTVPPGSTADVTALIGGNVKAIKVFHGDKIRKGQVLAVLEHPDYIKLQEDFLDIASKLEYLDKEYQRQKELVAQNVGSGKQLQKVKSDFYSVKARYEGLKSRLKLLNLSPERLRDGNISNTINILSPINGYVDEIMIKVGTYTDEKTKMFSITDNDAIHADFQVYEKDAHLIKIGQKVHFTVSNLPGTELTATIFAIGKEFEPSTRSVHIHAKLIEKPKNLIPGMYITGHIHTDEIYTKTLPEDAIVSEGTKSYIFVLDKNLSDESHNLSAGDGKDAENKFLAFRMVEVFPGQKDDGYVEVKLLDSLDKNAKIVMNKAYYLLADMNKEEYGE